MNKKLLVFGVFFVNLSCFGRELPDFERFKQILGIVESNNNDFAIGDKGKSIGRYQIQKNCYLDACEYDKSITFSYESLTNKENSDKVVRAYCFRYEPRGNYESWARLWNSGPNWKNKKEKTNSYWRKFKKYLDLH